MNGSNTLDWPDIVQAVATTVALALALREAMLARKREAARDYAAARALEVLLSNVHEAAAAAVYRIEDVRVQMSLDGVIAMHEVGELRRLCAILDGFDATRLPSERLVDSLGAAQSAARDVENALAGAARPAIALPIPSFALEMLRQCEVDAVEECSRLAPRTWRRRFRTAQRLWTDLGFPSR